MRLSITSPLVPPSPNCRRVGIRIVTFEACSGFTRVTARRIAQPPKATFVTRLQPLRLPGRAARQLPDQSTTIRVESSSTGDSRLWGALPSADLWRTGAAAYGDQLALPVSDLNVDKSNGAALTAHAPGASDRFADRGPEVVDPEVYRWHASTDQHADGKVTDHIDERSDWPCPGVAMALPFGGHAVSASASASRAGTLPCDLTPSVGRFRDWHCALVLKGRLLPRRKPLDLTRKIADSIAITAGPRSPLGTFQVFLMRGLVRRGQARGRCAAATGDYGARIAGRKY